MARDTSTLGSATNPGFSYAGGSSNYAGSSVDFIGDIDGDGFDDVLVGAYGIATSGRSQAGGAYILLGGDGISDPFNGDVFSIQTTNNTDYGGGEGSQLGWSVSSAGDVDNDGITDIVLGAPNENKVYVIYGSYVRSLVTAGTPDWDMLVQDIDDDSEAGGYTVFVSGSNGYSVDAAGDIDGDGFDDILFAQEGTSSRYSYVSFGQAGGTTPTTDLIRVTTGDTQTVSAGNTEVAGIGDVNNDGVDDFIVGDTSAGVSGGAYVVFGDTDYNTDNGSGGLLKNQTFNASSMAAGDGRAFLSSASTTSTGHAVAGVGDVNGDGIADFAIGAPGSSHQNIGQVYVIFGSETLDDSNVSIDLATYEADSNTGGFLIDSGDLNFFGKAISAAGDLNDDGFGDILIGDTINDEAYVIYGKNDGAKVSIYNIPDIRNPSVVNLVLDPTEGYIINKDSNDDQFGTAVAGGGDVNGDGLADIIVGFSHNATGTENGGAHVLYSAHTPRVTLDLQAGSDTGTSDTDNKTTTSAVTIDFGNLKNGASISLESDIQGVIDGGGMTASQDGTQAFTTIPLIVGTHNITATQFINGIRSTTSTALTVEVFDTNIAAPGTPDLAAASDSGNLDDDNITNVTKPVLTGTGAEAGAIITLNSDQDGDLGTVTADGSGNWTFGESDYTSPLSENTHSLTVTQTDVAGVTSAASTGLSVQVDTTGGAESAPTNVALETASDTGSNTSDGITFDTTPTITGDGAASGALVVLTSDLDGAIGQTFAAADGTWSITSSALGDGTHSITAGQADFAGNPGQASTPLSVQVIAPYSASSAPDLVAGSDTGRADDDDKTTDDTPTLTGTGAKANQLVTLVSDVTGAAVGSATADGSGNWTITTSALAEGTHNLTAQQSDAAGNSTTSSALSVEILPTSISAASDFTPADNGTLKQNETISIELPGDWYLAGGAVTFLDKTLANGSFPSGLPAGSVTPADDDVSKTGTTTTIDVGLPLGLTIGNEYTISFGSTLATGVAGTTFAGDTRTFTLTAVAATPTNLDMRFQYDYGSDRTDNITSHVTPWIEGQADPNAEITVTSDIDGVIARDLPVIGGDWDLTPSAYLQPLSAGTHTLSFVSTFQGFTSTAATFTTTIVTGLTASAPDLVNTFDSGSSDTDNITSVNSQSTAYEFTGTTNAPAGSNVVLFERAAGTTSWQNAEADEVTVQADGTYTVTSVELLDGAFDLRVEITDPLSGAQVESAETRVTVDTDGAVNLSGSSPVDDETDVDRTNSQILLEFEHDISLINSGFVDIYSAADDTLFDSIDVTDTSVVNAIGNVLYVDFQSSLAYDGEYYVNFDAGIVTDILGNDNAALTDKTTFNFTVEADPSPAPSPTPTTAPAPTTTPPTATPTPTPPPVQTPPSDTRQNDVPIGGGDGPGTKVDLPANVGMTVTAPSSATRPTVKDDGTVSHPFLDDTSGTGGNLDTSSRDGVSNFMSSAANNGKDVIVNSVSLTTTNTGASNEPITISASTTSGGNTEEVLVIDASALPPGTVLNLEDIGFAIIIGPMTLRGGAGSNILYAGAGSQNIVLGPDDDVLHGVMVMTLLAPKVVMIRFSAMPVTTRSSVGQALTCFMAVLILTRRPMKETRLIIVSNTTMLL